MSFTRPHPGGFRDLHVPCRMLCGRFVTLGAGSHLCPICSQEQEERLQRDYDAEIEAGLEERRRWRMGQFIEKCAIVLLIVSLVVGVGGRELYLRYRG